MMIIPTIITLIIMIIIMMMRIHSIIKRRIYPIHNLIIKNIIRTKIKKIMIIINSIIRLMIMTMLMMMCSAIIIMKISDNDHELVIIIKRCDYYNHED